MLDGEVHNDIQNKMNENYNKPTGAVPRKYKIAYRSTLNIVYFHLAALYGLYLCFSAKGATIFFNVMLYIAAGIGMTAGAHRLWSHRSYKAKLPLQILLMLFQSLTYQYTVISWVQQHRLHHKYSDTDADPHNASRGFFFSHIGWLLVSEHDEVTQRINKIDVSDVTNNPVLSFQRKYAFPVIGLMCFALPTFIPMYFWDETFIVAWHINMLRYTLSLNATFLINSAAHIFGNRPYDVNILPAQNNFVSLVVSGEGFHNYHHVFPWDYRAAELGNNALNASTLFIDFFAWIGWAYDLRTAQEDMIRARAKKTGDGTDLWGNETENNYNKVD